MMILLFMRMTLLTTTLLGNLGRFGGASWGSCYWGCRANDCGTGGVDGEVDVDGDIG